MTKPIKLPPLPGCLAFYPLSDRVALDAYILLAVEQATAELRAEVERLRAAHKMSDLPMSGKSGFQVEEPVAVGIVYTTLSPPEDGAHGRYFSWLINPKDIPGGTRLYTAPPARRPLTDEEIDKLPWCPSYENPMTLAEGLRYFARAIERAHGITGGNDE
jgi:hypothetical protein